MKSNDTAKAAAPKAPAISEEEYAQIRAEAQRIAAQAPSTFSAEQRELIGRTWVRALRKASGDAKESAA